MQLIGPHKYDDDGGVCKECALPASNARHDDGITTEEVSAAGATIAHTYIHPENVTVSVYRSEIDGRVVIDIDGEVPNDALAVTINDNYIYGGPA